MADVAQKCIAANDQVSGRTISRMPGTRIFKTEPKIVSQYTSDQLDAKYDDRFDHRAYYNDASAT